MKNLTHILQVYAEVKVKVIIVLTRVQNVELQKRNIGENLSDFGQGRDTLDTSKASPMKEKNDKLDFLKTKNNNKLFSVKDTMKQMKRQARL